MALYDDDEDLFITPSSGEKLTSPDQAKKEAYEQKAKSKGNLLRLQRALLAHGVKKGPGAAAARKDAEANRSQSGRQEEKKSETFGTKSHRQMEEAEALDAQADLTSENLMEKKQEEEEQKRQAGEEYAGDEV